MDADQQRAAHHAHFSRLLPELVTRLGWTRPQIDAHKTHAFRALLAHVKAHSPFHAARTAHLDPDTATPADIQSLPTMDKAGLMANWDAMVAVPGASRKGAEEILRRMTDQTYVWGDNVLLASGGTGGPPGLFLYDWSAMAINWGAMTRGMNKALAPLALRRFGAPARIRNASICAENSAHGSYVMGRIFSNPLNPTRRLSAWRSAEELVPELNEIQPHVFFCYPTFVPALAEAARAGRLRIKPLIIFFGSEHLSEANRLLAKQTWPQAAILTCWATSEGAGTFPCSLGDGGFHVCEDLVLLEPVDGNGAPVRPGERSAGIYLTNLFNKALPIIRYFIDDMFEMDDKPCACGSAYLKVRQVHGRGFEKFHFGATAVHPLALELAVLEQPNIIEYQIRQTAEGAHLLFRRKGEVDTARLEAKMRQALIGYGLAAPVARIEEVARLERTPAGKLKRFVPLGL